jgi:large subunit ribosomal protein L6
MKRKISETIEIPSGIQCQFAHNTLSLHKGQTVLKRKMDLPQLIVKIDSNKLVFECEKGNKTEYKTIYTLVAHVKNMIQGLEEPFVYRLESANVHFPMTMKVSGSQLIINNFLGEKTPRTADIYPNVKLDISGQKITITSADVEAAGQTAANIEKATRVPNRDRRIFQDGIYITEKPGRRI